MEKSDPGDNQNSEQERILEILDYWHKIEFFVPFDLEKMIDDSLGWQVIWLHKDDLKNEASTFWSHRIPGDHVLTGFALYLGIFDKSVASAVLEPFLKTQTDPTNEYEDAERAEIEGSSCFAKINLDQYGQPSFDRVSISTFPWALGQVKNAGFRPSLLLNLNPRNAIFRKGCTTFLRIGASRSIPQLRKKKGCLCETLR